MAHDQLHDRRQFQRLRYPHTEHPTIELMGHEYPVCEISEEGIARIKIVHNNISGEYYIHKLN